MNIKRTLTRAAFCVAALSASFANAATLNWTLQGVQFADQATASGWFTADSVTGNILSWDITTTAGSTLSGYHYDTTTSFLYGQNVWGANANSFLIANFAGNNYSPYLNLSFDNPWTSAGVINVDTSTVGSSGSWECANCSPARFATAGTATTQTVPEPGSMMLVGLGLAALGAGARRKKAD